MKDVALLFEPICRISSAQEAAGCTGAERDHFETLRFSLPYFYGKLAKPDLEPRHRLDHKKPMSTDTSEKALEACIERFLTGGVSEGISEKGPEEPKPDYTSKGYLRGAASDFNAEFALDEAKFWQFLESTQTTELAKLHYKPDSERQILERLHRKLKKDGILAVLKKELDVDNAHFDLLYRLPYNELNPEVTAKFESNIFSVTRQIYFSTVDQKSVDMVIFLNGLPLATLELKNPWTGQNVNHAKKQYREDRDPKETLFQFKRCLVHFAVDPDEVWMTTKVDGKSTYFIPFNKGLPNGQGKGNPVNPHGHKSAYLWQEILTRHSLSNIIEHYAKLTVEKDKAGSIIRILALHEKSQAA